MGFGIPGTALESGTCTTLADTFPLTSEVIVLLNRHINFPCARDDATLASLQHPLCNFINTDILNPHDEEQRIPYSTIS